MVLARHEWKLTASDRRIRAIQFRMLIVGVPFDCHSVTFPILNIQCQFFPSGWSSLRSEEMTTMERIGDSAAAEAKVLRDMKELVAKLMQLSSHAVENVQSGDLQLREIRSSIYENLNQIQHEFLLLRGLAWLSRDGMESKVDWDWNPRQTGGGSEPDLRGSVDGRILVSAEASTSENPRGILDSRMKKTLEKLSRMEGRRYYFVSTDEMAKRAETKIRKAKWSIRVVKV
jgi:hypothetical protein